MTVQTVATPESYVGNGVTTLFPVNFNFFLPNDLLVVLVDTTSGSPVTSTLALNGTPGYSVAGGLSTVTGLSGNGSITTSWAPTAYQTIIITPNFALTQQTHYVPNSPFPAASHENALDRLTLIAQQNAAELALALTIPVSSFGVNTQLPAPAPNMVLGWDGTAQNLVNVVSGAGSGAALQALLAAGGGSSNVGYLPSGTGAVQTSVQTKLQQTVSVLDFGAVGDGVTNDLPAIQKAIAYLQANGGGTLEFPKRHLITSKLTLAGSITGGSSYAVPNQGVIRFQGTGSPESGIVSSISSGSVIQLSAVGNLLAYQWHLRDMVIDCQNNNVVAINGQDPNSTGGNGNNHYVDFAGVKIVGLNGSSSVGIWLGTITDSVFNRVRVQGVNSPACSIGYRISRANNNFTDCFAVYCNIGWWKGDLIEAHWTLKGGGTIKCNTDFYIGNGFTYSGADLIESAFIGEHPFSNTYPVVLTVAPSGTSSGTLTVPFAGPTGTYSVYFYYAANALTPNVPNQISAIVSNVTLTNGSTAISWGTPVVANCTGIQASSSPTLGRILDRATASGLDACSLTFLGCTFDTNRPENLILIDYGCRFTMIGCALYSLSPGLNSINLGTYVNGLMQQNTFITVDQGSVALVGNNVNHFPATSGLSSYKAGAATGNNYVMSIDPTANTQRAMPAAGSIIGIGVVASQTIATGTPTVSALKNGGVITGAAVIVPTSSASAYVAFKPGSYPFAAGDLLSVELFCGTYTPSPTDFSATLFVQI